MTPIRFVEKTYRVIANKDNGPMSIIPGHTLMANNNPGVFGYISVFSSGPTQGG